MQIKLFFSHYKSYMAIWPMTVPYSDCFEQTLLPLPKRHMIFELP